MKRVLITGANSYVGTNVEKWLMKEPDKFFVETLDMKNPNWKKFDFSNFDVVFHVAGIAHVSTKKSMKDFYYKVNRDLAIETAEKAKESGVKQFIFMSSIIVYGNSYERINSNTKPNPINFYGKSKLEAEKLIKKIESSEFAISIMRPPMIYGINSKGNYRKISKLAKKIRLFPKVSNKRSMIHIDNLSEFIKILIEHDKRGTFYPQNKEYVETSSLVKKIAEINKNKVYLIRGLGWLVSIFKVFNPVKKIFGNLVYDDDISIIDSYEYRIRTFHESIKLSETEGGKE